MKELNVCLINDSFPPAIDGVANAVKNYADIIQSSYGKATVVTPLYPEADYSVYSYDVVGYPSIDTTKLVGYRTGLPFNPGVFNRLEKADFDIIHSHCPITSTLLARTLRDRIDKPLVLTYHTKFDIDIANAIRGKLMQKEAVAILAENISGCDEVWTVSRGAGENLRKIGYRGDYIVMPNGVDLPRGRVSDSIIQETAGMYDLPADVPVFLFVGRMMWYKGLRIILDALAEIKAENYDFRMVFVGGGGDRAEIISYASSLKLDEKVVFVPPVYDRDRIRAWYCRADMFLFPSTFDTNGLVVREAAACSLASVLIKGSCAAEDSADGVNSVLIEENSGAMAACLKELIASPEMMKQLGENACRDLYVSWNESVDRAYQRYGTVIEKYRAGEYPRHNQFSDEFFHRTAESLEFLIRAGKHAESLHDELSAHKAELRSVIDEDRTRVLTGIRSGMRELHEDIREGRKHINELAEELYDLTDRFM